MKSISQSYVPVSKGPIEGSIIALTISTAIAHLLLAFGGGMLPMDTLSILWLLNGIGFLGLLAALYLPFLAVIQPFVRWVLIAYTALTFVTWVVITHAAYNAFDYTDNTIQIAIILLLIIEAFQIKMPRKS